ncbi:hypothetical protein PMI29_02906 [Pseudomonas sp. GM49]|uniref:hypothetical protein n=1 Tax=Pseudomonas sp. GM49 TaxID=1144331 RepID=UPI000270408E|nr:hypothetical protein [Pseudomonas sp. GM49]EJM65169.1 hypothetical protein PMI29_02906 [Pseudomonas sp. GM49]
MITRLQVLKLIQIAFALPAYTVPFCTTYFLTLSFVVNMPILLLTSRPITDWEGKLLWIVLLLFSQWACWSIFADGLEDTPSVRHLPLLLLGVLLTLLLGASVWIMFRTNLIGGMCGLQGIAASVLLIINLVRKKAHARSVSAD